MSGQARTAVAEAPKLLYSIGEVGRLLSLSRSTAYELVWNGSLATVHIGKRRLVPADELERYVAALAGQAS